MRQTHEWSGDLDARFMDWVGQFYAANIDQLFEPAIMEFGKERVRNYLTRLRLAVLEVTEEQFSEEQIGQFLAAMEEVSCFDEVERFCRQITECQRLWSILTGWGVDRYQEQLIAGCDAALVGDRSG